MSQTQGGGWRRDTHGQLLTFLGVRVDVEGGAAAENGGGREAEKTGASMARILPFRLPPPPPPALLSAPLFSPPPHSTLISIWTQSRQSSDQAGLELLTILQGKILTT